MLAVPGMRSLLVVAAVCRLPLVATSVVLTLHVVVTLDLGYAAAGLAGAIGTLGTALGAPWRGRLVDRVGLRRALLPSLVVESLAWGVGPFLGYRWLCVSVLVGGLFSLPVFSVVRQSIAVLVPEEGRRAAFALDSAATEVTFMVGPLLAVVAATQFSTRVAMIGIGVAIVASALALMVLDPPVRTEHTGTGPVPVRAARSSWFGPQLLVVLGAAATGTLVLAGTDVAIVAFMREADAVGMVAVVGAAWAAASLVGGLVYGALSRAFSPLLLVLLLGLLTIPVGLAPSPWLMLLTVLPAGLLCAPVLTAGAEAVSRLVPESARGEAMGWFGSACTVGLAVGAPLAGAVMDASAPWAGFTVVGAVGVVLGVAGLAGQGARRRRGAGIRSVTPDADRLQADRQVPVHHP